MKSWVALTFLAGLFFVSPAVAQDWPQILGPDRNGTATAETLLEKWPEGKLKTLWKRSIGQGYAGPVIKGDSLVIFHRVGDEQICERLNKKTGEEIWKVALPAVYAGGGVDPDLGPKAVPTIAGDRVILYGPSGNLYCLDFKDGNTIWKKAALKDYRGREGFFGAGSSPLVVAEKVIVNIGGENAGLVAFDLNDGSEVWKSVADQASYSSPIACPDGATMIAVTRYKAVGLNLADGKIKFEIPFGKRGPTVNGANPVLVDNHLFLTAAYNVGARWIKLSKSFDEPKQVWANDETFSSQYSTPVFVDGHFYGTAGREDFADGTFRCFEAETGKVKWEESMPVGHSLLVDGRIICIDSKGVLHVIRPTPEKFVEEYSTAVFLFPTRCIPAISDGRLYVRSNTFGPKGQLVCLEIGQAAK